MTNPALNKIVADRLIKDLYGIKAGDVVAIGTNEKYEPAIIQAMFDACADVDAKPLVLQYREARQFGAAGMADWPTAALEAALKHVDVWLDFGENPLLYSPVWENVLKENTKIRYNVFGPSTSESLERVFCHFDVSLMEKILKRLAELATQTSRVRVTNARGTDVSFDTDPNNLIDFDSGDYSAKKFGTAPGYLNLVPKSGSMSGRIVFDAIMHAQLTQNSQCEFIMRDGSIVEFVGTEAQPVKAHVDAFNEENMYKISHMMVGLSPNIHEISNEIVEDERIWGGVDFGFGHTSPMDMPPDGQPASSHFDSVVAKVSIWFDDVQIFDEGEVVWDAIKADAAVLRSVSS
ncbi:MAG: hypothetical protein GKR98_17530 [Boseongicola sp.]|nr:MAG: hypothetical protein GKR98_17530 [Boseongicola sp.]